MSTDPPKKKRVGAPSKYTDKLAAKICERIAGGESLRAICESPGMPDRTAVYRWLRDEERAGFRHQYARAREDQADTFVDQICDIADGRDQKEAIETPEERRIRIDARKWVAGKLGPKKYGSDRLQLAGPDGGPIQVQQTIQVYVPDNQRDGNSNS